MTDTTQAVVTETPASAEPEAKVEGAREGGADDLESLLAEFDQGVSKTAPVSPPEPTPTATQDPRFDQIYQKLVAKEVDDAVKEFMADTGAPSRRMAKAYLEELARENPTTFGHAFIHKDSNPKVWERLFAAAKKEYRKEVASRPDPQATEDRAAVVQAVRGASTPAPAEPPPQLGQMTDQELREYTRKNFGF